MTSTRKHYMVKSEEVIGTVTFTDGSFHKQPHNGTWDLVKDFHPFAAADKVGGFITVRDEDNHKRRVTVPGKDIGYTITLTPKSVASVVVGDVSEDVTAPVENTFSEEPTV